MATSSSTTVDVVAARPIAAQADDTQVLDRKRHQSSAPRPRGRALDALLDVGALMLAVWLMPFVILAVSSPIVLTLWAFLALIHRL